MLAPGGEIEEPSELATLALESRRLYPRFIRDLESTSGCSIDFQERGALDVSYSAAELTQLERRAAVQSALGIASKPVTAHQVASFWPYVRIAGLAGARFYPDDAIVDPRNAVGALIGACQKLGVELVSHCSVSRATVGDTHVELRTERGQVDRDLVIIAAGAWSSCIAVQGVPSLPASEPVRGHLIGYRQPAQTCPTIVRRGHTYLLQRANGLLIAGATSERVGFAREIDTLAAQSLASEASFVFPHLGETTPMETWIGFRPGSERLQLGGWHSPRLLLAYGHYRNGILLAPVTAQRVVEVVIASSQTR